MAFPFGGHPTFTEYLSWAVEQGCKIQSGVDTEQSIGVTKIISPSGKWAIVSGILPTERLVRARFGFLNDAATRNTTMIFLAEAAKILGSMVVAILVGAALVAVAGLLTFGSFNLGGAYVIGSLLAMFGGSQLIYITLFERC